MKIKRLRIYLSINIDLIPLIWIEKRNEEDSYTLKILCIGFEIVIGHKSRIDLPNF
jgi:hypothetical protein